MTSELVENSPAERSARPIALISADAQILIGLFEQLEVGETLTYAAMSAAIGRDVLETRGIIYTAIRRAMRDGQVVVECVQNVGFKRIAGRELIDAQRAGVARIRGEARRRVEKLTKLDARELSNDEKVAAMALQSAFGALAQMATSRKILRIESAVRDSEPRLLGVSETLALFDAGARKKRPVTQPPRHPATPSPPHPVTNFP